MKITTKTTKETLKNFLAVNAKAVKETDKDLFDRLVYADKMCKTDDSKVQKADLVALVKEVQKVLGDKCVEPQKTSKEETPVETSTETTEETVAPKAENSVKKLSKKSKTSSKTSQKATETPTEEPKTEEPVAEEKVDAPKKSAKKSLGKKKETPKDGVAESSEEKTAQNNTMFPETLDVEGEEFKLAHEITSMDDLYKALENGERVLFAFYWTKKLLKQYPYFNNMLGKVTSFKDDLDLANTIYVSEERKVAYHISIYTEGCYNSLPEDYEEVDGIRYAGTTEFQIYKSTANI